MSASFRYVAALAVGQSFGRLLGRYWALTKIKPDLAVRLYFFLYVPGESQSTLDRNSRVRASRGWTNISSGVPSSQMTPSAM